MEKRLTQENSDWRKDSVILLDNATIHDTPYIKKLVKDLKLPVEFAGKGAFNAIPIEAVFNFIKKRYSAIMDERLEKEDMVGEVGRLHSEGVSWKRLIGFGLEYKYISLYLTKKLDYDEMLDKLFIAISQFSKKQMTWFRRWEKQGAKIHWVDNKKEADKLIRDFLK